MFGWGGGVLEADVPEELPSVIIINHNPLILVTIIRGQPSKEMVIIIKSQHCNCRVMGAGFRCGVFSIQKQLRSRNVKRFRGGLVSKAHRPVYHSTLGSRVIQKKKQQRDHHLLALHACRAAPATRV